jgi:hypothetical protein
LWLAGPQGKQASREAARAADEALKRAREALKKPEPEPKPGPTVDPLPPKPRTDCPDNDKEPCPVCKRGLNPTPGTRPAYLYAVPPRPPKDYETNPPLNSYKRTNKFVHGARVYQAPSGMYYHVDTFHKGSSSEIEVYGSGGKHLGAVCPHCGSPVPNSRVPGRKLPD